MTPIWDDWCDLGPDWYWTELKSAPRTVDNPPRPNRNDRRVERRVIGYIHRWS
jgi:hypothetical protein